MSKSIDERIVRMQFDNASFESNINQSMSTLDKFDNQLNGLGKGAGDSVRVHVSALDAIFGGFFGSVGQRLESFANDMLHKLTAPFDAIKSKIEQTTKELTVDQIGAGWDKYTSKAESVQTMMGATRDYYQEMLGDSYSMEAQMELINEQMEKLNWYTDETSYSYSDMANNIAKFTSNGIALEDATDAMMGIASWGASAGATTAEVGRAMYNISQAMATGVMTKIDWKSVENANMATQEFKQMAIQAAILEGNLEDLGDGTYAVLTGKGGVGDVNQLFQSYLTEGKWFDSDVMMDTFDMYGQFSAQLYDFGQVVDEVGAKELGLVSQQLELVDAWKEGTAEGKSHTEMVKQLAEDYGISQEDAEKLAESLDILSDEQYELGMSAFKAGQEYKTFKDVIDATKDAASTRWMNIFEKLFGDLLTAKGLWSDIGEGFYEIFVGPLDVLDDALDKWVELGGRNDFFSGIKDSLEGILNVISAVEEVLYETFFSGLFDNDSAGLMNLSATFKDWAAAFKEASTHLEWLQGILRGFIAVIRVPVDFIRSLVSWLFQGAKSMGLFGSSVREAAGSFGEWLAAVLPKKEDFDRFFQTITNGLIRAKEAIDNFLKSHFNTSLADIGSGIKKNLSAIGDAIKNIVSGLKTGGLSGALSEIKKLLGFVTDSASEIKKTKEGFIDLTESIKIGESIDTSTLEGAGGRIKKIFTSLGAALAVVKNVFAKIAGFITNIKQNKPGETVESQLAPLESLSDKLLPVKEALEKFLGGKFNVDTLAKTLKTVAGVLVAFDIRGITKSIKNGINGVADIPVKAGKILDSAKKAVDKFGNVFRSLSGVLDTYKKKMKMEIFKSLAESVLMLSASIFMLAMLDAKKAWSAVGMVSLIIAELVGVMILLNKYAKDGAKGAATLLGLSVSVLILSSAVKKLAKLPVAETWSAVGMIALLVAELGAVLFVLGKNEKAMTGGAMAMIVLASAVLIMSKAIKKIASMDPASAWRGFAIVSLLLIELTGSAVLLGKKVGVITKAAKAIKNIAAAVLLLGLAVKLMGSMELGDLVKGVGGTIALIAAITVALNKMPANAMKGAGTMIAMAAAIIILSTAVAMLGLLPFPMLLKGLAGVVALLIALSVAVKGLTGNISGAASILIVSAALVVLTGAVALMGALPLPVIAKGMIALGLALAGLVVAVNLLSGSIMGALSLAIIAASLNLLIPPIMLLGQLSLWSIIKALIALAGAFAVIGIAGAVLGPIAPFIMLLAGAIALMGVAVLATGAGVMMLATGLTALAAAGVAGFAALIQGILMFVAALPLIVTGLVAALAAFMVELGAAAPLIIGGFGKIISAVLSEVRRLAPEFLQTATVIFTSFLQMIIDTAPKIMETIGTLISGVLGLIKEKVPEFVDTAVTLLVSMISAMKTVIPEFVEMVLTVIDQCLQSLAAHVPNFVDSGMKIIIGFLQGIASNIGEVVTSFVNIITETLTAIGEQLPKIYEAGIEMIINIINGIADGIEEHREELKAAMTRLAKVMIDTVKDFLGIHSPSSVFRDEVGVNIVEGIKDGINAVKEKISGALTSALNAAKSAAQSVASTFSEVGGNIVNGLKSGIEWAKDGLVSLGASLANAVKGGATSAAQINSPSKVFAWIGEMMDLGLANGLIDNLDDVTQAGGTVADEAAMALRDAMNHVGDAVDDDLTMTPVIRPVVDLSDIKSGSAQMDKMLNSGLYTTGVGNLGIGTVSANSSLINAINSMNANQNPYGGINIYVTGGDGANAEEIADEVMRRLDREVQRRKAVFA